MQSKEYAKNQTKYGNKKNMLIAHVVRRAQLVQKTQLHFTEILISYTFLLNKKYNLNTNI